MEFLTQAIENETDAEIIERVTKNANQVIWLFDNDAREIGSSVMKAIAHITIWAMRNRPAIFQQICEVSRNAQLIAQS